MKIAVWSETILYGGVAFLVNGMRKFYETDLCVLNKEPYKYGPKNLNTIYFHHDPNRVRKIIHDCDLLIISATIGLRYLMEIVGFKELSSKPIAILIGDSHYCNHCHHFHKPLLGQTTGGFNSIFRKNGIKVFLMPDKYQYCDDDIDYLPYFPPVEFSEKHLSKKYKRKTVLHLPGTDWKRWEKGYSEIIEVFEKIKKEENDVIFKTPKSMSWKECMICKSKSHIYIDQLIKDNENSMIWKYKKTSGIKYDGGLGKAGIESMYVGCLTMTSGNDINTEPYFPKPPVIWIDLNNFENTLRKNLKAIDVHTLSNQIHWARTYANPKFVAKYILENLIK